MRHRALWTAMPAAAAALLAASPAAAQLDRCPAGSIVMDGTGKRGIVVGDQQVGNLVSCRVDIDNGPKGQVYPAWKLKLAEPAVAMRTRVKPGHYACGNRTSTQASEIVISASSLYIGQTGSTGNYTFDPNTQTINFLSGEYLGFRGRNMRDGMIQLSRMTSATSTNMVCTWRY